MTDKEKQIEEMAYSICGMPQAGYTNDITDCAKCFRRGDCIYQNFARRFLEKGHRQQSEVVKEFAEKVKQFIVENCYIAGDDADKIYKKVNALAAEYGVEVEK